VDVLRKRPEVESVRGVEPGAVRNGSGASDLDIVPFQPDHRPFAEYLARERIDSVIECGLAPDRTGRVSTGREADVIGTMCLGAAIGSQGGPVRSWVLASSSTIYPIASHSPLVAGEDAKIRSDFDPFAASIAEAEDYARDVAHRSPHINVSILRLQQLVGKNVDGPLASLLRQSPVPSPIGFDPSIQLLHVEDAARALAFASVVELAGVYNVASTGQIHWDAAVARTGHRAISVLPMGISPFESILGRLGIPFVPANLIDLLRFGHVVDTRKIERAGWKPEHDQASCLATLA